MKLKSKAVASTACILLTAAAVFACSRSRSGKSQGLLATKQVDLLVQFSADIPFNLCADYEKELAQKTIVPFLKEQGIQVGSILSMTEISVENGTPYGALLSAMRKEPKKDSSRFLFVRISADPAEWPGKIISNVVVVDSLLSGMQRARASGTPPGFRLLGGYEGIPARLTIEETIAEMPHRVREALIAYDIESLEARLNDESVPPDFMSRRP